MIIFTLATPRILESFIGKKKGFMKTYKAFIKPFQTSQRSAKINITVNFLTPSGIEAGNVKSSLP